MIASDIQHGIFMQPCCTLESVQDDPIRLMQYATVLLGQHSADMQLTRTAQTVAHQALEATASIQAGWSCSCGHCTLRVIYLPFLLVLVTLHV